VPENSEIFLKLARRILSKNRFPVIVAGKNPSEKFQKRMAEYPLIRVVPNPTDQELDELVQNAQVNLLHTSQSTGIKLKLIHALYSGRHCLVNAQMIEGTGLESLCVVVNIGDNLHQMLDKLMALPFNEEEIRKRTKALKEYSNRAGAEKILRLLG